MSETEWKNFDITSDELERFTNAFKSDKFRQLFADYCKEITDPENRRIYEKELKLLEAERGNDVIFINPEPGFVVKTTPANAQQKVFINIARCDKIERPSSQCGVDTKTGQKGLNWRIPYVQSPPKHDFDKNKVICAVFDVIFHSDTLHLASKNSKFKKLVIDTACDAIKTAYDITLDTCNLKLPKMLYKGSPAPAILRKKLQTNFECDKSIQINNNNDISTADKLNGNVTITTPMTTDGYTTPKYELIHRRHVEMHELTDEMDSKLNVTLPKELVIKINLPLLSSSKDVLLDVNTKSIHVLCETPAKYKLTVDLPYEVDKEIGTAQFDSICKILTVTLPILKRRQLGIMDLCREDSGVESDQHSPKEDESITLDNDVFEDASDTMPDLNDNKMLDAKQRQSNPVTDIQSTNDTFLDSSICYTLPHFTYNRFENIVAFTLHVKNVESDSIVAIDTESIFRLKFTSIGCGYFKNYYAFYFSIPNGMARMKQTPRVEAWDNNVVIQIELNSIEQFHSYDIGMNEMDSKNFICPDMKSYAEKKSADVEAVKNQKLNYVEIETAMSNKELQIEITNKNFKSKPTPTDEPQERTKRKKSKTNNKKARSLSESHCDDLKLKDNNQNTFVKPEETKQCCQLPFKARTQSESSNDEHQIELFPLKSILKRHSSYDRTTPECSLDEHGCSLDLGIGSFKSIPEEKCSTLSESVKKTVRFDKQLCRKLLFRMNSTIIGQRKPKENKRKKKKRSQERRYSEGEASDYENHLQTTPCGGQCQKNIITSEATKKEAETKNNLIFDIEI